jgi:hypothetical protein
MRSVGPLTELSSGVLPGRLYGSFTRAGLPALPPPQRVGGGGGWIKSEDRPRRKPRELTHVASGGVAVGGAAAIWFNELEITDTQALAAEVLSDLEAAAFDVRRLHRRLTGEQLAQPPDFEDLAEAIEFLQDAQLEWSRDLLAELDKVDGAWFVPMSKAWQRVLEICRSAFDLGLVEYEDEDEEDDEGAASQVIQQNLIVDDLDRSTLIPEQLAEIEREDEELLLISLAALE